MENQDVFNLQVGDDEIDSRYLTFWTDGQLFGLPVKDIVQIVGMQRITEIPEFPPYARGIISLRGEIIPVIDIRLRLDKQEAPYSARTCIIITKIKQNSFGFIVDEVDDVSDISDEQIALPPHVGSTSGNAYLTGIARLKSDAGDKEKIVLVIDTANILGENELAALTETAQP